MYNNVKRWLDTLLRSFIERSGLRSFFTPEYMTYDIKSDITGIVIKKDHAELILIECKLNKISLRNLSQMIGYSRVVKPRYSLIISPKGLSEPLKKLLTIYNRVDILRYGRNRSIAIAKWDYNRKRY